MIVKLGRNSSCHRKNTMTAIGIKIYTIGLSAGIPVSRFLHEWKKGTILFVAGKVVDDEFQTRQQGKPVFKIQVELCIEQPDYYTMYNVAPQLSSYEKSSSAPRDDFQGYIPPPTF